MMNRALKAALSFASFLAFALSAAMSTASAQPVSYTWKAQWITHPTMPLREPIVLHFRKSIALDAIPATFPVRVSADNRFVLYVNGQRVGDGPARGDLNHWRFESFDLAPMLKKGDNLLTAVVWNFGVFAPVAQITDRTAFLLEGDGPASNVSTRINTEEEAKNGKGWQVEVESGRQILPRVPNGIMEYMACGPGELLDANQHDWNWETTTSTGAWVGVASPMRDSIYANSGTARSVDQTADVPWALTPDLLPHTTYEAADAGHVVRSKIDGARAFPAQPVVIPANSTVHVLLDRGALITAYPLLAASGGKDGSITLTYAEALYDDKFKKGDRNEVGSRQALGVTDKFILDGGSHRSFEPLWWRTWRYLDLEIVAKAEPVTLESLTAHATMFPFEEQASFRSSDPELSSIWDISWRTARLDAHETYMDTPYWEQLQYIGDTRVQAMISYSVANDDRLARQAIAAFDESRTPDGITASRYPTQQSQIIPPFSLLWVGMLHDYWMYRTDPAFVQGFLPGERAVLGWFEEHEATDHLLRKLPFWSFLDWTTEGRELPSYGASNESCATSLQYLGALDEAAELESALGDPYHKDRYRSKADQLRKSLYEFCWDAKRGLVADTPEKTSFSEQGNILGVLHDVIPASEQKRVLTQILSIQPGKNQGDVIAASHYFRFYLARALDHAGMADAYLGSLGAWRDLLPLHFSTWPEVPGDTRSDSHAWSAHPIYDLLTLVAGVEPAAPGFAKVRIAPHLGDLKDVTASFPHPKGMIRMEYHADGNGLKGQITVPEGVPAVFVWKGHETSLRAGSNTILLP